jgi:hypothetical protein
MKQNPEEEIQEPVEGATQEPEVPMTQEQIDADAIIKELQSIPEAEGRAIFGASEVEAARQLEAGEISPQGYAWWQENKPDTGQLVPATREQEQDIAMDKIKEGEFFAEPRQMITSYPWQRSIKHNTANSPNGYVERLFNNKEYDARLEDMASQRDALAGAQQVSLLVGTGEDVDQSIVTDGKIDEVAQFDVLGNSRDLAGLLNSIVDQNHYKAFESGRPFDAEKAHINLLGKLYIDLAFKLGKDWESLDLQNQEFRDFLGTSEAVSEVSSGLALLRDARLGKHRIGYGEGEKDMLDRITSRGVFDGSGQPSAFRAGVSEEEWEEKSTRDKTLGWFGNMASYSLNRLHKATGIGFSTERRFTTTSGQVVGTIAPYMIAMVGAARTANAAGLGRLGTGLAVEVAGALADYGLTIEGEGNLANILKEHEMLPEMLDWLAIEEGDKEAGLKNMIEGGIISAPAALIMMGLAKGSRAAIDFGKKFTPQALTDDMMEQLAKGDSGFYKGRQERIVKMYSGIPDLGDAWSFITGFRALGEEASPAMKKALKEMEDDFAKQTKGMEAHEIAQIKKSSESRAEEVAQASFGKEWKDLGKKERFEALEYSSREFKEARAWLDSQKGWQDLKNADPESLTDEQLQSLSNLKHSERTLRGNFESAYGVDLREWEQGSMTLREFLGERNIKVDLTPDEVAKVKEARAKQFGAEEDERKMWENIGDDKMRDRIRKKIGAGEELDADEAQALSDATNIHTDAAVADLEDTIAKMREGGISESERELFKHSRNFKKWLDGLEEGELKQGILESINSGRKLTDTEMGALKDAGVTEIYERLRKKGMLGVDSDETLDILEQADAIDVQIKETVAELDKKQAKSFEAAEKKVERKAKKLQDLNDEFDEASAATQTADDAARELRAKKGVEVAEDDIKEIQAQLKDTEGAKLKELEKKAEGAEKRLAAAREKLELERNKSLTPAQKKAKQKAQKELDDAKKDSAAVRKMRDETPSGKLRKLLSEQSRAEKTLAKMEARLAEDAKPLTKKELKAKADAEKAIAKSKAEIETLTEGLTKTERGKLRKLLKEKGSAESKLKSLTDQLRGERGRKLTGVEAEAKADAELEITRAKMELEDLRKELAETEPAKLRQAQSRAKSAEARAKKWQDKLEESDKPLTKAEAKEALEAEKALEKALKEIESIKVKLKKNPRAKLESTQRKAASQQKRVDKLQKELDSAGRKSPTEDEVEQAQKVLDEVMEARRELEGDASKSGALALDRANTLIDRARQLAEATDEATGQVDPHRLAIGELGRAMKAYNLKKTPLTEGSLERAFYRVQKARVDLTEELATMDGVAPNLTQAHKLTRSYDTPAALKDTDDTTKFEAWSRNNANNGNWQAKDIADQLNGGFDGRGKSWGGKEMSENFLDFMDTHAYFRNGSIMRPAWSLKYGVPVWLQGSRLMRVASAVTGIGTSNLAFVFGIGASFSRGLTRGMSRTILSAFSSEVADYSRLIANKQLGKKRADLFGGRNRSLFQALFTPSRRTTDVSGAVTREIGGQSYGAEGALLEHGGKSMDAASMTMLGMRAQNIESDGLRDIMTGAVGLFEFMPREVMGFVDDTIKQATFDKTLKESVVDTIWKIKPEKLDDIEYVANMVNAIRDLEEAVKRGEINQNEVRSYLGKKLGADFTDDVKIAASARDLTWENQRQLTLQQEVTGYMKVLQDASRHPLGGHYFMFGKTVANTINMGIERLPIIGFLRDGMEVPWSKSASPKEKIDSFAKQITGVSLIGAGYGMKEYFGENVTEDRWGNYVIKWKGSRDELIEAFLEQQRQQPGLLKAKMDNHNDWSETSEGRKQGARKYSLDVEGDKEAFIDNELLPTQEDGYSTIEFKRFGHAWGLFSAGIALNEMLQGDAQHLPKSAVDESGLGSRFIEFLDTFTNAYGMNDIVRGVDQATNLLNDPGNAFDMAAIIVADALTPWKGLLQSPGEPLERMGGRRVDWDAESWWGKVLQRNWWYPRWAFGQEGVSKRDAMFEPMLRGDRLAMLGDIEHKISAFTIETEAIDIHMNSVAPKSVKGLNNIDTYSFTYKDEEGVSRTAYEWIMERASTVALSGSRDITKALNRYFAKDVYQKQKAVVLKGLRMIRGLDYTEAEIKEYKKAGIAVPPTDFDEGNEEHRKIKEAAVEAQAEIRAELKFIQGKYLDQAVKDFRDVHHLFKSEDDVSVADYLGTQKRIEKGASTSRKSTWGEWKALMESRRHNYR